MKRPSDWTPRLLTLAAGLAAGLAHPPFGFLPGLLGYAVLLGAVESEFRSIRLKRSAFLYGWLAGVGYFGVGVWWITEPFQVDAANQGWMAPFALLFMAGGLALFWGAAGLVYRWLSPRGVSRVLVFAGVFAAAEWLRGHVFTGFPWNLPGETWAAGGAMSQTASVVGAYGMTWITIALAASPILLLGAEPRRARFAAVGVALLALAGLYGAGAVRLADTPAPAADAPRLRIVQANIDQKDKWKPENLDAIVSTYVRLTRQGGATPAIVVWPEGALPAVIDDLLAPGSPYVDRLAGALAPGQTLMLGANRAGRSEAGGVDYFNSLVALRREAGGLTVSGVYDKHRLVPFGEFLPLGDLATRLGIRSLVHMPEDFTAGPEPRPLTLRGLPGVQPLICYEALFPGFASAAARRTGLRPAWLLNVSNDAWFGGASGPLQHLNIASYRAIEEGLPIVRATPTGVSTVIDAHGRAGVRLGLGMEGVIDAALPAALPATPYARFGDAGFAGMLLISAAVLVFGRVKRRPLN
ncbi:apolipoprotein N-acyltransferase [Phenylobacterium sp.]|uniref:apolipoprotein N-acyltransferase n=1 Tax=Phenylobacterium sp. TaxID=1871053 RepID=UPI00286C98D1|nr:apolipoprotein N-acyltransferase [Phenylobacterium sp.]